MTFVRPAHRIRHGDWTGAANNLWNTSAINWADLGNGDNPTNYAQPGGFGDVRRQRFRSDGD